MALCPSPLRRDRWAPQADSLLREGREPMGIVRPQVRPERNEEHPWRPGRCQDTKTTRQGTQQAPQGVDDRLPTSSVNLHESDDTHSGLRVAGAQATRVSYDSGNRVDGQVLIHVLLQQYVSKMH